VQGATSEFEAAREAERSERQALATAHDA